MTTTPSTSTVTPPTPSGTPAPAGTPPAGAPAGTATPPAGTQAGATPEPTTSTEPTKGPDLGRLAAANRKLEKELRDLRARDPDFKRLTDFEARFKDPKARLAAIDELLGDDGYTDLITHRLRANGHDVETTPLPPEVQKALERVSAVEAELAAEKKSKAELEQQNRARQALEEVKRIVGAGGEKYAFTAALDAHAHVLAAYKRKLDDGEDADEDAVAAEVESSVERTITQQITGLLKSTKGKALLRKLLDSADPPSATSPPAKGPPANGRQQVPAVNNSHSAAREGEPDLSKLSPAQRRERALARLNERTT